METQPDGLVLGVPEGGTAKVKGERTMLRRYVARMQLVMAGSRVTLPHEIELNVGGNEDASEALWLFRVQQLAMTRVKSPMVERVLYAGATRI